MEEKKGFKDVACKPNITIFEWPGMKRNKTKRPANDIISRPP
ncbi:hypothetical protein [Zhouia spongiae]|nr:hypothetical protein [Zhouia spongiae]